MSLQPRREPTIAEKIRAKRTLHDKKKLDNVQEKAIESEMYSKKNEDIDNETIRTSKEELLSEKKSISVKDCSRSDIAELMRTLKETREQANRTSSRLAENRAKAVSEQVIADLERKTFIKEQEERDQMSLKSQQYAQGHSSSDIEESDTHIGQGKKENQLYQGLVVVQGRRDLISQLRQGSTETIHEDSDEIYQKESESEPNIKKHVDEFCNRDKLETDKALRYVERIRKEQDQEDEGILDYSLLIGASNTPKNNSAKILNEKDAAYAQKIASASSARAIAHVLKEASEIEEYLVERTHVEDNSSHLSINVRDSNNTRRAAWNQRIKESGGLPLVQTDDNDAKRDAFSDGVQKEDVRLSCLICGRTFKKQMHLRLHANVHQRKIDTEMEASSKPVFLKRNEEYKKSAKDVDLTEIIHEEIRSVSPPSEMKNTVRAEDMYAKTCEQNSGDDHKMHHDSKKKKEEEVSNETASRLTHEVTTMKGPDMDAMHRLWEVLQSEETEVMDTGIINQVLGTESTETKMINASRGMPNHQVSISSDKRVGDSSVVQMERRKQQFEEAQLLRQQAVAEAEAVQAKKQQVSEGLVELDSQRAKLEAMMEAMGAAGTKDISTLAAHAHGRGGALTQKDSAKVTTLINGVAVDKIGQGELTMKEAGAAMHAMMHRSETREGVLRDNSISCVSKLAAGTRYTGHVADQAVIRHNDCSKSALIEAREEWPDLWQKWVSKLSEKGLLDGMPEGSDEREQQLERAAIKFLQCKAIVSAKARRVRK